MSLQKNIVLMAQYNQWINKKIYHVCAELDQDNLTKNLGAFFGSILETLNHILVADIIWLKRFTNHPHNYPSLDYIQNIRPPLALNQILYDNFHKLQVERQIIDNLIIQFSLELQEKNLDTFLDYQDTKGNFYKRKLGFLIQHFFNHQTHHRGQITTLLSQLNIDIGSTDLLLLIPDND